MTHDPKHIAALADVISQSVGEYVMPGGDLRLAAAAVLDLTRPKPLVWEKIEGNFKDQSVWCYDSDMTLWIVQNGDGGKYGLCKNMSVEFAPCSPFIGSFDTLEAAKAAAFGVFAADFWAMSGIGGE